MADQWSCTKFESGGKRYFVSIAHRSEGGGEGVADLALTDGELAWTAEGVTAGALKGAPHQPLLSHLLAALSELRQPEEGLQYSRSVKQQLDGGMELRVEWKAPGSSLGLQARASLVPAAAPPVLAALLDLLVGNLTTAKAVAMDTLQQLGEFEKTAARSQELVDKYVASKAQQDREANAKVAGLLNSKKRKLRELQAQLKAAQEEIEKLRRGGPTPMDADDGKAATGAGGAGGSGQAAGAQQGGPGQSSESEEDDEDSSSEEDAPGYQTDDHHDEE